MASGRRNRLRQETNHKQQGRKSGGGIFRPLIASTRKRCAPSKPFAANRTIRQTPSAASSSLPKTSLMLRLADDGRSFALLVNSESGQHGKPKRSSAKCSASTEMTPSSEKHYGWIIFSPLRAVFLMSPFMPWSCHAAECRGKRRRHRSPKWKTVSKQARQTCGRRTEDELSDDGDRPKNAIVGQHFNGKLEWHCEEDRQRERLPV